MPLKQTSLFDFDAAPAKTPVPDDKAMVDNEMVLNEPAAAPITNFDDEVLSDENTLIIEESVIAFDAEIIAIEAVLQDAAIKLPSVGVRGRKKLTDTVVMDDIITVPDDDVLFQKKYYAIGVVADMFKVNISLIRFWEKEFDILKPKLNGKGDRHFRPEDVKNLKLIYHLLRERKYTIEGAKAFLKKNKKPDIIFEVIEDLKKTKQFLIELKLSL